VYGFFAYRMRSRADAEDLTQLTFERALRSWSRYDPSRAAVATWLLVIARNLLIDHHRADRSTRQQPLDDLDGGHMALVADAEPPDLGIDPDLERALAGLGANLAVQLPARRRDAASLRVVGVSRRAVMVGVVEEFLVVLGAAALAGVAAGAVAQYVVIRTVTLGFADSSLTPRVLPSFDLTGAATVSAGVLGLLLVVATGFAVLTVRGARTSSLRENAR